MNRRTILIAVLLGLTSCSSDKPRTDPSTAPSIATSTTVEPTTPPSTTTSSTSTTVPTTVAVPSDPPSTALPTDDWRGVIETLGRRRQDLYANPDVSRIPEVCGADTPCFDQLNVQLGDLASKGWRVTGADPYTVIEAHVEKFDGETLESSLLVTVVALVERPLSAGEIVDSTGAIVASVEAETPGGMNSEGRTILARIGPDDDPWRIVSEERLREVPA